MTLPLAQREPLPLRAWAREAGDLLGRPAQLLRGYRRADLRPDLIAGLTVAVVLLPQAIAYALIAELPPQMGLYTAIIAAIIGALWGSSSHLQTGPTNAASLLVLSTLVVIATPGSPEYLAAASLMALLAGLIRFGMGIARLGLLANFVSDSVILGFTAGAGLLIGLNQLRYLLRVPVESSPLLVETAWGTLQAAPVTHLPSLLLGLGTIALILLVERVRPRWPATLLSMSLAALAVALFGLKGQGVVVLGAIPRNLPPFAVPSLWDVELARSLLAGASAVAAIGLVEAMSIARAIAAQSGEHVDSNQEFVGQGLANIGAGLFSGYPCSGSFTRSAVNYAAGARTAMAGLFSGLWMLAGMWLLAPLAIFLPRAALAGILIVTAYRLVDRAEMGRIWRTSTGDSAVMIATLLATLLLPLEFAVLSGVLVSFLRYIVRTSTPAVESMLPDESFSHFEHQPERPECPQLGVLTIEGSLYFGATAHVKEAIRVHLNRYPEQRFLLLRMHRVNLCDVSGLHMLEAVVRLYRRRGGDLYMVGVRREVWDKMQASGFDQFLGADHFLSQERAISHLFYKVLDPALCIYRCRLKVWQECQSLPKCTRELELPPHPLIPESAQIPELSPEALWAQLQDRNAPLHFLDVREPEEWAKGHIPGSMLLPLPTLLEEGVQVDPEQPLVLVCRSGRRSAQALYALQQRGLSPHGHLAGGMVAWEAAGLPVVIE